MSHKSYAPATKTCRCGVDYTPTSRTQIYRQNCLKVAGARKKRMASLRCRAAKSGQSLHDLMMQDKAKGGGL